MHVYNIYVDKRDAKCLFNSSNTEEENKCCRNIIVEDLVNITGNNFEELAVHGAVFGIEIIWKCFFVIFKPFGMNFTWSPNLIWTQNDPCLPTYNVTLVDPEVPGNGMGEYPGWYIIEDYYRNKGDEDERTLYHLFGLELKYKVTYKVSYLNPIRIIVLLMAMTGTWATFEVIFWLIWAASNIQNFDTSEWRRKKWEECDVNQVV